MSVEYRGCINLSDISVIIELYLYHAMPHIYLNMPFYNFPNAMWIFGYTCTMPVLVVRNLCVPICGQVVRFTPDSPLKFGNTICDKIYLLRSLAIASFA